MSKEISVRITIVVPDDLYDRALEYLDQDDIYSLLDMAEDYRVEEAEYEE